MPLYQLQELFFFVEYLGIVVGGVSGAVAAIRDSRYKYDIIGVFGLGMVCALGGGILRDVVVQDGPPLAFRFVSYLFAAIAGCAGAMIFERWLTGGAERALLVIDAASLGLFAVAGCIRAQHIDLGPLPALLVGMITALGGSVLQDVLSGRTPRIFERGQLYAIPALIGSALFLVCEELGVDRTISTLAGGFACFAFRMLALRFDWRTNPVRGD